MQIHANPLHSIIKNSDIHEQYHEALSGGKKMMHL
jgi:hypothetical protein